VKKELLIVFALVLSITGCINQPNIGSNQIPVKLVVNYSGYSQSFDTTVLENTSAFDLLKKFVLLDYKESPGLGAFINGINNVSNTNTDYWMFYIDGNQSGVGVSSYFINKSVTIEMKYEKPSWGGS